MRFIFILMLGFVALATVCVVQDTWGAEKYTIKQMTPEVSAALESRRDRYETLQQLKKQGKVGENNQGYLEAFSTDSDVKTIVGAENADRAVIYKTIAQQNNLSGALSTIEKVFAQTQRDKAEPNDKIQEENGEWRTK